MSKEDRLERNNTFKKLYEDMKILPESSRQQESREDSQDDSKISKYNRAQINEDINDLTK